MICNFYQRLELISVKIWLIGAGWILWGLLCTITAAISHRSLAWWPVDGAQSLIVSALHWDWSTRLTAASISHSGGAFCNCSVSSSGNSSVREKTKNIFFDFKVNLSKERLLKRPTYFPLMSFKKSPIHLVIHRGAFHRRLQSCRSPTFGAKKLQALTSVALTSLLCLLVVWYRYASLFLTDPMY